MNILLLTGGILITLWAIIEGLWTTLWIDGSSAPITSRVATYSWRIFKKPANNKHRLLSLFGPLILLLTVSLWILFIITGWTLIFYSSGDSLVAKDNTIIDFTDTLWYISYNMFTVGNGDYSPAGNVWQIVSSMVSMTGMLMVTLSVTYILQVVSAVVNKRAFANEIISIGSTPEQFVINQWKDGDFGAIEHQIQSISEKLGKLTEQHLAYPILHYYHAEKFENSLSVAVALFDDALTIINEGIPKEYHPPITILLSGRNTVKSFLQTLDAAFIDPAKDTPEYPELNRLREANIPVISEDEFKNRLSKITERRKLLAGLVKNDAWHMPHA